MKRQRRAPSLHFGVSAGTVFMLLVTAVVLGLSGALLPKLLGKADLNMDISGSVETLNLTHSLNVLTLSDIPIANATPVPEATSVPEAEALMTVPAATATPVPGGAFTLTIGGSVNIDEGVRKSAYYSDSKKYDFTEIMMLLQDEMDSDLTMLTLENVTYDRAKVSSVNVPSAVMDMLADAGVDLLALGYPKALDEGSDGLKATISAARERRMTTLGAYESEKDANELRLFTVNNVNIAFLHFTSEISSTGKKAMRADGNDYALPTTLVNGTPDAMLSQVRAARSNGADIVIVSLNWGAVSASKPTTAQRELAQQLTDAGADIIVGAGSRVVQPIDWLTSKDADGSIRHTLCAWSLGSLINESRKDGNVLGMLLQLHISFDGYQVSFEKVCYTPTYVWKYKQDGMYHYRITVSDQEPPDGMSEEQAGYMEKALRNLQKYLGDSPVTIRSR